MKIALISQEYPPETARGGIGTQTYAKARGLSALGHQVFVISRSLDENRYESLEGNITVIRIPGLENMLPMMTPVVEWLTHSTVVSAEVETLHQKESLDIIDFPEWAAEAYTYLLNRNEWNKVPTVIQLHGPLVMLAHTIGWPEVNTDFYRLGSAMEAECIRLADAVYSSSACSARWVRTYYDDQKENIPVIHLGVDVGKFSPKPVAKYDRPTILFSGKIVQNKGVEELVEAAAQLAKEIPDLHVRLLGRGDEKFVQRLQEKATNLGAPDLLHFPGFVNQEKLPVELSKAHLFAAPSYYEGGPGFVYLEAMACGLPVIGCSGSGVEEVIEQGKNGLLVPPKDAVALKDALQTILCNRQTLESMSVNARDYILEKCDSEKCLQTLEAFYRCIIQKQSSVFSKELVHE